MRRATLAGMLDAFLSLVGARRGHFAYESGHHGDFWLDLETLCHRPSALRPFVTELCAQLAPFQPEVVCGPLIEGAFVALLVAEEMPCTFTYANRMPPALPAASANNDALFPIDYPVPRSLHPLLKGKRVAIVNDVINAGSAVRGAYQHLEAAGARVVAIATMLLLGDAFVPFYAERRVPLLSLFQMPNHVWTPAECPLCAGRIPLEQLAVA